MVENGSNYQMAIDLLCCHLGITEDEARDQLGIGDEQSIHKHVVDTQQALMGLNTEK
ncbi:hypothetical protein P7F88_16995 [Vibrio hannami]|uniref:hypothetical protein n=1 Tax=Vibrio hannami TaxID=2717094 RepID=UPI00240EB3AA|nr:hypothetical protein [Vibrio hannami]MDG3087666.1 hypothetical protein [Vibrio hannami]